MYTYIHTYIHTLQTYIHTYKQTNNNTYIHTYIHTYMERIYPSYYWEVFIIIIGYTLKRPTRWTDQSLKPESTSHTTKFGKQLPSNEYAKQWTLIKLISNLRQSFPRGYISLISQISWWSIVYSTPQTQIRISEPNYCICHFFVNCIHQIDQMLNSWATVAMNDD